MRRPATHRERFVQLALNERFGRLECRLRSPAASLYVEEFTLELRRLSHQMARGRELSAQDVLSQRIWSLHQERRRALRGRVAQLRADGLQPAAFFELCGIGMDRAVARFKRAGSSLLAWLWQPIIDTGSSDVAKAA